MRYLLLTPNAEGKDGVSCLTRLVASAIAELGGDVEVWSLWDDARAVSQLSTQGVQVRGAGGSKARAMIWSLTGLGKDCRALTVIVMHAHLAPLCLPFRWRGARVFQMLLGIEVWKPLTALQAMAFRASERLVCISGHTERRFAAVNAGFDSTLVCHLGVSDRGGGGELEDDGFALMVGRMASAERYKGHDAIFDIWPDVVREASEAKLVIVGDGDDRERLMERARAGGYLPTVRFTGEVSDDELNRLYRRCAFFVMPSVHEGFGLVFLEAMRASKACIGGVGAAAEIIDDGKSGFIVDPADSSALTGAIVELFTRSEQRVEMGIVGRERFEKHFTSESFRARLQDAFALR